MGLILLQMALALLLMAKNTPNVPENVMIQIIELSNTAIQVAMENLPTNQTIQMTYPVNATTTNQVAVNVVPVPQPVNTQNPPAQTTQTTQPTTNNEPMNQPLGAAEVPTLKSAYLESSFNLIVGNNGIPARINLKRGGELDFGEVDGTDIKRIKERQDFWDKLTWESYIDGKIINSLTGVPEFPFGNVDNLTIGNHSWKILLKESGREDTIFEGAFTK